MQDEDQQNGLRCGGADTLVVCEGGFYCPDVLTKIICPEGHFCREGSTEPQSCPFLTNCPEGTRAPTDNYVGILAAILVFLFSATRIIHRRSSSDFVVKSHCTLFGRSFNGDAINVCASKTKLAQRKKPTRKMRRRSPIHSKRDRCVDCDTKHTSISRSCRWIDWIHWMKRLVWIVIKRFRRL